MPKNIDVYSIKIGDKVKLVGKYHQSAFYDMVGEVVGLSKQITGDIIYKVEYPGMHELQGWAEDPIDVYDFFSFEIEPYDLLQLVINRVNDDMG